MDGTPSVGDITNYAMAAAADASASLSMDYLIEAYRDLVGPTNRLVDEYRREFPAIRWELDEVDEAAEQWLERETRPRLPSQLRRVQQARREMDTYGVESFHIPMTEDEYYQLNREVLNLGIRGHTDRFMGYFTSIMGLSVEYERRSFGQMNRLILRR